MSKLIKVLISINACVALVLVGSYFVNANRARAKHEAQQAAMARFEERSGFMPAKTYTETRKIIALIARRKYATDDEAKALLALASARDPTTASDMAAADDLYIFSVVTSFTPFQKEAFFQFAVKEFEYVAKTQKPNNGFMQATSIMVNSKDARSVPYLLPLVSSSNATIAETATKAVGYLQKIARP